MEPECGRQAEARNCKLNHQVRQEHQGKRMEDGERKAESGEVARTFRSVKNSVGADPNVCQGNCGIIPLEGGRRGMFNAEQFETQLLQDMNPNEERDKEQFSRDSSKGENDYTVWFVSVLFCVILLFATVLYPNYERARACGKFTQCQSNCKNIGMALDMYAIDHDGHFPSSISELSPRYLKSIPTCLGAGKDSYSPSYSVLAGKEKGEVDAYTFYCSGLNHKWLGVDPNYPQYNSRTGLTAK